MDKKIIVKNYNKKTLLTQGLKYLISLKDGIGLKVVVCFKIRFGS